VRFPFDSSPLVLLSYRSSRTLRRITLTLASVVTLLLPATVLADTITLKNGDHITGAVSQMTGGKLTIHTDYADDVNIDFAKVTAVKIDKPVVLSIETKTGKKLSIREVQITAIDRTADGFAVTTTSGTENMAAASVTTVRTPAAQQAYEASLRPGWLHDWTGVANLSLALARGNSDTTTLGVGVNLVRPTPTDKTSLYFNDIYTHDGILNSTTADHIGAGARYDYNLGPKFFLFGTADFATDSCRLSTSVPLLAEGWVGTRSLETSSSLTFWPVSFGHMSNTAGYPPYHPASFRSHPRPTALPHSTSASNTPAKSERTASSPNRLISSPTSRTPVSTAPQEPWACQRRSSRSSAGRPRWPMCTSPIRPLAPRPTTSF